MKTKEIFEHAYTGTKNDLNDFVEEAVIPLGKVGVVCFIYFTIPIWIVPYWFVKRWKALTKDEKSATITNDR